MLYRIEPYAPFFFLLPIQYTPSLSASPWSVKWQSLHTCNASIILDDLSVNFFYDNLLFTFTNIIGSSFLLFFLSSWNSFVSFFAFSCCRIVLSTFFSFITCDYLFFSFFNDLLFYRFWKRFPWRFYVQIFLVVLPFFYIRRTNASIFVVFFFSRSGFLREGFRLVSESKIKIQEYMYVSGLSSPDGPDQRCGPYLSEPPSPHTNREYIIHFKH